ncbi:glycoside hydrolase family 31 protein [Isoptericola sp. b490]|uniref:glycoside hydrolase family 31 protein n=1 Tax=Actinotalea lenta TaxID=3064654 RepID=UPI0027135163|nr:glycoside hydrolase family 31 protein [Isoptericola sp. b490]MDO8121561.1 glycoside hydrolase family 31 protein [Isoptericola sp. b490]
MKPAYRLDSRPVARPEAVVRGERYRITVLTEGLVRLEYAQDGQFEDRASTFAINRELPVPQYSVHDRGDHLEVVTARFRLTYDKGPFTTSGLSLAVRGGISSYHSVWRYGTEPDDLGGTARTLDEADGAIPLEPGVVSRNGYAAIDDSGSLVFDDEGWVAPRTDGRQDLYVFAFGHDYAEAITALYAVAGPTPVLPRWALGNWWSRYYAYTAEEYRALLTRFRVEGIPFSVSVIDMDWHVVDVDPEHGSGWTGYTWNRDLFPDPESLLDWLHEHGLRVTLNVHPADGVRSYEEAYPAMAHALGRDPAAGDPIAFDVTDREFLTAYFDVLHRGLEAQGVDFWWLDWQSGPHSRVAGIDPLWMLNHFHYLDNARDGRRGLTFSRYAGPGSHRYPIGFSGDTVISWASLAFQPHFTATASNIGYGWWSHDIGGHFFGTKDDELATRWLQLGTFSPVLRLHSGSNEFTTKEPWSFAPEAAAVMTRFLRLRHRLIPYLHTMNHRAAAGTPLVLPLYYRWPEVEQAYHVPNEYLFGDQLLVAAITEPADARTRLGRVDAWLPEGTWVDVLTDQVYDGDREIHLHRDLSTIPVLAAAGAIVPLDGQEVPGNEPVNPPHLQVLVVVGADGAFTLVEDDGARDGARSRTGLTFSQGSGTLTVTAPEGAVDHLPATRTWTVTFPAAPQSVEPTAAVDGSPVALEVQWEPTRLSVRVDDVPIDSVLEVTLGADPQPARNDVRARLFDLLDRARVEYALKSRVLEVATRDRPLALRAAEIMALELEPALASAVAEVLLAQAD